jgi:hypothetical protein
MLLYVSYSQNRSKKYALYDTPVTPNSVPTHQKLDSVTNLDFVTVFITAMHCEVTKHDTPRTGTEFTGRRFVGSDSSP